MVGVADNLDDANINPAWDSALNPVEESIIDSSPKPDLECISDSEQEVSSTTKIRTDKTSEQITDETGEDLEQTIKDTSATYKNSPFTSGRVELNIDEIGAQTGMSESEILSMKNRGYRGISSKDLEQFKPLSMKIKQYLFNKTKGILNLDLSRVKTIEAKMERELVYHAIQKNCDIYSTMLDGIQNRLSVLKDQRNLNRQNQKENDLALLKARNTINEMEKRLDELVPEIETQREDLKRLNDPGLLETNRVDEEELSFIQTELLVMYRNEERIDTQVGIYKERENNCTSKIDVLGARAGELRAARGDLQYTLDTYNQDLDIPDITGDVSAMKELLDLTAGIVDGERYRERRSLDKFLNGESEPCYKPAGNVEGRKHEAQKFEIQQKQKLDQYRTKLRQKT